MERRLGVEINNRANQFRVIGSPKTVELAARILNDIYAASEDEHITKEKVHFFMQGANVDEAVEKELPNDIALNLKRGVIRGRTTNQKLYLNNIQEHDVNFGIGPAGTGKTYLAVACAVAALEQDQVRRIVLVRPAVEAGEKRLAEGE